MATGNLLFTADAATVFRVALTALAELGWKIVDDGSSSGVIRAKTKASLWSWGEDVELRPHVLQDGRVNLIISSEATAQLIDWGRSKENVNRLGELLLQRGGKLP